MNLKTRIEKLEAQKPQTQTVGRIILEQGQDEAEAVAQQLGTMPGVLIVRRVVDPKPKSTH